MIYLWYSISEPLWRSLPVKHTLSFGMFFLNDLLWSWKCRLIVCVALWQLSKTIRPHLKRLISILQCPRRSNCSTKAVVIWGNVCHVSTWIRIKSLIFIYYQCFALLSLCAFSRKSSPEVLIQTFKVLMLLSWLKMNAGRNVHSVSIHNLWERGFYVNVFCVLILVYFSRTAFQLLCAANGESAIQTPTVVTPS